MVSQKKFRMLSLSIVNLKILINDSHRRIWKKGNKNTVELRSRKSRVKFILALLKSVIEYIHKDSKTIKEGEKKPIKKNPETYICINKQRPDNQGNHIFEELSSKVQVE